MIVFDIIDRSLKQLDVREDMYRKCSNRHIKLTICQARGE
jgi:hypothetical protein